ncbi:MAG: TRAP transporter large permease subunit, partial [Alcaligenaceae bacterium]
VAFTLMAVIYGMSYLPGYPELRAVLPRATLRQILRSTVEVWPALLAPFVIMGGILGGIFTATEAGVIACIYSLAVSVLWYRAIAWKDLFLILIDAAITTAMVAGVIGMAGALGWMLSFLSFNDLMLANLRGITESPMVMLLILLALMLLLTMLLDGLAVVVVLVPTIVYIGQHFALDPMQLGILMIMITQIAGLTPPVAILLFITTSIAKTSFMATVRESGPFVGALLFVLAMVVLVPSLATWLPGLAFAP